MTIDIYSWFHRLLYTNLDIKNVFTPVKPFYVNPHFVNRIRPVRIAFNRVIQ